MLLLSSHSWKWILRRAFSEPYAGIEVADFLKEAAEKEDAEDEEKKKQKYKDILSIAKEKRETFEDSDMEMEITWEPGLCLKHFDQKWMSSIVGDILAGILCCILFSVGLKEATEDLVDKKTKKKNKLSPWEKYLEKSKTKKSKKQTKLVSAETRASEDLRGDVNSKRRKIHPTKNTEKGW